MKFQVTLKTTDYRGYHSADVTIALDVEASMTIGELVEAHLKDNPSADHIEVRKMVNPHVTDY